MSLPSGYIEKMNEYAQMAKEEAARKENRWWRRIPRERKERKIQENFNNGFSWALIAYYVEKKDLDEIKALSSRAPNGYTHFDEGADIAIRLIEHHRILGILQGEYVDRYRNF